ncbi:hypothetical protein [Pectobacterium versatile]|uniref:hypothetical protein n=1 Tax=Pectobacterium versatile TaxID=2488639 RepID=UPI00102EE36A|nr:hypothetical protein [Pectobacterium versatile]TAI90458.1 hypothetical protein EG333_02950 [Pectobacterium versatile]
MNNLKNVLDACDIFISGEFVEHGSLDFYPACGLHTIVIRRVNFGHTENYSILVPATDWEYVKNLNLVSGGMVCVPVVMNFDFDCPLIWLSDRHQIAK